MYASENKLISRFISTKDKIEKCEKSGIYEIKLKVCKKCVLDRRDGKQ